MNQYIKKAKEFLETASKMMPPKTEEEAMQICEKLWAAWAQATKAYKYWKTEKGYHITIGTIYKNYPEYKTEIKEIHKTARFLHSDGAYEGVYLPEIDDIEIIKKGISIIEKILNKKSN